MEKFLSDRIARLPRPVTQLLPAVFSVLAGLAAALVMHYLLYRVGLPGKPFIYVAF